MELDLTKCTGCCACANGCPVQAITMREDKDGFIYPYINSDSCIECGKCKRICDGRYKKHTDDFAARSFAVWSQDKDIRYESTSGGAFSEFAKEILSQGGVVAGAAYDEHNGVEHVIIDAVDKLSVIRQSKYVQCNSKNIYKQIKDIVVKGRLTLFCGTPCQVAALRSYLDKEYENLIYMDFICLGVNSPKALKAWLTEVETEEKCRVNRIWFKYKKYGWRRSPLCTRLDLDNGKQKIYFDKDNKFMKGYIHYHLYIRPSCTHCAFKGLDHGTDVMLADFWGLQSADDNGTSLVIVNSKKGNQLFEKIKENLYSREEDFSKSVLGNPAFRESAILSKYSRDFLCSLDSMGFNKAYKKYARDPLAVRFKNIIKGCLKVGKRIFRK